jgi:AcrR family transcriptional regulator
VVQATAEHHDQDVGDEVPRQAQVEQPRAGLVAAGGRYQVDRPQLAAVAAGPAAGRDRSERRAHHLLQFRSAGLGHVEVATGPGGRVAGHHLAAMDNGTRMSADATAGEGAPAQQAKRRLLRKDERRAQLIQAAAHAFLAGGFAATSLDDVAAQAGVTRMIIYRHFDSKSDLYRAVLLDTRQRIEARIGVPEQFGPQALHNLVLAARENPDGFRLLYRHARREPDFAGYVDELSVMASDNADRWLREIIPDPGRRAWIARLLPTIAFEGILTWLDTGQPVGPDEVAAAVNAAMRSLAAGADRG